MKIILVSIFLSLSIFKDYSNTKNSNDACMLKVDKILGSNKDVKKVFFLVKNDSSIVNYAGLTISYNKTGRDLILLNKNMIIGYYTVENGKEIKIDNNSSKNSILSYIDMQQRIYSLKIEYGKGKQIILKIKNFGEWNKLDKEVTIFAHDLRGNFEL